MNPRKVRPHRELTSHCFNVQSIKSKQDALIENRIDKS